MSIYEKVLKKAPYTLFQPLAFSEGVSRNSENLPGNETNFDMGFQKKNIRAVNSNIDFFESDRFLRQCLLNDLLDPTTC
jgi:hypothetical protein